MYLVSKMLMFQPSPCQFCRVVFCSTGVSRISWNLRPRQYRLSDGLTRWVLVRHEDLSFFWGGQSGSGRASCGKRTGVHSLPFQVVMMMMMMMTFVWYKIVLRIKDVSRRTAYLMSYWHEYTSLSRVVLDIKRTRQISFEFVSQSAFPIGENWANGGFLDIFKWLKG